MTEIDLFTLPIGFKIGPGGEQIPLTLGELYDPNPADAMPDWFSESARIEATASRSRRNLPVSSAGDFAAQLYELERAAAYAADKLDHLIAHLGLALDGNHKLEAEHRATLEAAYTELATASPARRRALIRELLTLLPHPSTAAASLVRAALEALQALAVLAAAANARIQAVARGPAIDQIQLPTVELLTRALTMAPGAPSRAVCV